MAFPDLFKLDKLKIFAYSDVERKNPIGGKPFEAMFNPQTLSHTNSNLFAPGKTVGGGKQSAIFVRTMPSDLKLNLLLDGTGVEEMGLINLFSDTVTVKNRIDS